MHPLTATTPKPLLRVGDRTMLDHVLDKLHDQGIGTQGNGTIVVNAGYLGEQIIAHCATRTDVNITISREAEPLETGGGVKQALPLLGSAPFFVINADLPWLETGTPALARLEQAWRPEQMDVLLLVMPLAAARGFGENTNGSIDTFNEMPLVSEATAEAAAYAAESPMKTQRVTSSDSKNKGDFAITSEGRLTRQAGDDLTMVYIGAMIIKPELYAPITASNFSNNLLWHQAEVAGRLFGCVHNGTCYHVGTPPDLTKANALLANGVGWGR
jgi:N-acetyl-alpha-D-muramate 1-phosphate uridylyltransferase